MTESLEKQHENLRQLYTKSINDNYNQTNIINKQHIKIEKITKDNTKMKDHIDSLLEGFNDRMKNIAKAATAEICDYKKDIVKLKAEINHLHITYGAKIIQLEDRVIKLEKENYEFKSCQNV